MWPWQKEEDTYGPEGREVVCLVISFNYCSAHFNLSLSSTFTPVYIIITITTTTNNTTIIIVISELEGNWEQVRVDDNA